MYCPKERAWRCCLPRPAGGIPFPPRMHLGMLASSDECPSRHNDLLLLRPVCDGARGGQSCTGCEGRSRRGARLSRRPNLQLRRRDPGEPPSPHRREQSLRRLVEMKEPDWRFLISGRPRRSRSNRAISLGRAKLPQPARPSGPERSDWAFSSKDPGDLGDPYGHPHKQHGLAGADVVSRLARKG